MDQFRDFRREKKLAPSARLVMILLDQRPTML